MTKRRGGIRGIFGFSLLFDGIHGDRNEIHVAILEAAVGVYEIGKFRDTRAAGGGPEVDDADIAGFVFAEFFRESFVQFIEGDRHLFPCFLILDDAFRFEEPFGGAAEGTGDGFLDFFVGEEGVEGVAEVGFFHRA